MRSRTFRGASAAILSMGLLTTAFTSAQAAPAAGITLFPGGMTEMTSVCPTGEVPQTVYSHAGFEAGAPFAGDNYGFAVGSGPGAPEGSSWASSVLAQSDPVGRHFVTTNHDTVPQSGKLYLSFSYKGEFRPGSAGINVNLDEGILTPSLSWVPVILDITSQATTAMAGDKTVSVKLFHVADPDTPGFFTADDVKIYTCATPPPPNSGVRGDWTGQGTVDLLGTHSDGSAWLYEGKGNGSVNSGVKIGSGWSAYTWQGSPGDVNGDGRTDLLTRRSDGSLWFYAGKGNGAFASRVRVGTGWNTLTIATPGDFDLDGRPDLIVRLADGTLHLYRILSNGSPSYLRKIGTGWNGMSSIIGMGDLNGDRRGDVVAVRTDGTMFGYLSSGTGLVSARKIGAGWNAMTSMTSPGDMNRDGRADLIARNANGTLWFYAGRSGGGVISGRLIGSGWNGMTTIL